MIGVMSLLLVAGAAVMVGAGRGEERQASRSLILAALTNARTRALTSGEPYGVALAPYEAGREDFLGKALSIFQVREDEATDGWQVEKQTRRWVVLPGRMIFSKGATVNQGAQNAFTEPPVLEVTMRIPGSAEGGTVEMPAIIFGSSGNVVWPQGSGELELHLSEGSVQPNQKVITDDQLNEWQKREVFIVGRQTGRARYLRTQ